MRLPAIIALALLAFASTAAAQQSVGACGSDWRQLFERPRDLLVQPPEFSPAPVSGELFALVTTLEPSPGPGAVSVVSFAVDTLGATTEVEVICAPSEVAAEWVAALAEDAVFEPARQRGKPVRLSMLLPVALPCEPE